MLEDGIAFLRSIDEQLYLEEGRQVTATMPAGKKVFIGHGRSGVWRDLRDFIRDKLHLETDEYNASPAAGYFTPERVKESGLFQGRLGFRKAIVVLEVGCKPFSNVEGQG